MSTGYEELIIYVATNGNDDFDGLSPVQKESSGPLKTIHRALELVKTSGKSKDNRAVKICVRGGVYYQESTLRIDGNNYSPISLEAYMDEKPVLSGGLAVSDFIQYKKGIYRAKLDKTLFPKGVRQLFYKGERQICARWPKYDPENPIYGGWLLADGPRPTLPDEPPSTDTIKYKKDSFRYEWKKPYEGYIYGFSYHGCYSNRIRIQNVDKKCNLLQLDGSGWQLNQEPWYQDITFLKNSRFRVENLLEELDSPGEWCYESDEGMLYFMPPDQTVSKIEVVLPIIDCLIEINGASDVTITGMTFTETDTGDSLNRVGVEGVGAMYPREGWKYTGDTIRLINASQCLVENNLFHQVGGNSIYLECGVYRSVVAGNKITECGSSGIVLAGNKMGWPEANIIENNYIAKSGAINKNTAGISLSLSNMNIARHNQIENVPHHAINLNNNPNGRNIIEFNKIISACEEVADSGAINCWMESPPDRNMQRCGHIIRYNLISDTIGFDATNNSIRPSKIQLVGENKLPVSCIYFDNYTSNCFVYGNLFVRCSNSGIFIQGGRNNLIENNFFIDCLYAVSFQDCAAPWFSGFWKPMANFMSNNHISRNIIYNTEGGNVSYYKNFNYIKGSVGLSDFNIFYNADGTPVSNAIITDTQTVRENFTIWREEGYDCNSDMTNPMFRAPQDNDFTLLPNSPAFKLGIKAIPIDRMGLQL